MFLLLNVLSYYQIPLAFLIFKACEYIKFVLTPASELPKPRNT